MNEIPCASRMNEPAPTDRALAAQLRGIDDRIWWLWAACFVIAAVCSVQTVYLVAHSQAFVLVAEKMNMLAYCLSTMPGFESSGCMPEPRMEGKEFPLPDGRTVTVKRASPVKKDL